MTSRIAKALKKKVVSAFAPEVTGGIVPSTNQKREHMTHKEFYDTVVKMRRYQRDFFRSKGQDREALRAAKSYEQIIDSEIKRVDQITREKLSPRLNFDDNE